jgi:hypothetical protein
MRSGFSISGKKPIAVVVALVATATCAWAPTATATVPGGNGTLAVAIENQTVFLRTAQGSMTEQPFRYEPMWTRDGTGLLMSRCCDQKRLLYAPDGTGGADLGAQDPGPDGIALVDFLPDGRLLYLASGTTPGTVEIRARAADGTDTLLVLLAGPLVNPSSGTLSPDGDQLAFSVDNPGAGGCDYRDPPGGDNIEVVSLSTGVVRQLDVVCDPDPDPNYPGTSPNQYLQEGVEPLAWSPDGQKLLILRSKQHYPYGDRTTTVETVNAADGTAPVVHATADLTGNGTQGFRLTSGTFSPDGRFLAYAIANADATSSTVSYVALGSGSAPASFTVPRYAYWLRWQPLPLPEITSGPGAVTTDVSPTFELSVPEAECRLDSAAGAGSWAACSSPYTVGPLAVGAYALRLRPKGSTAADGVGDAVVFAVLEQPAGAAEPAAVANFGAGAFTSAGFPDELVDSLGEVGAQAAGDAVTDDGLGAAIDAVADGPGDVSATVTEPSSKARAARGSPAVVLSEAATSFDAGGTAQLRLVPTAAGRRLAHGSRAKEVRVSYAFTSDGGAESSRSVSALLVPRAARVIRSVSARARGGSRMRYVSGRVKLARRPPGGIVTVLLSADLRPGHDARVVRLRVPRSARSLRFHLEAPARSEGAYHVLACSRVPGARVACEHTAAPVVLPAAATGKARARAGGSQSIEALTAHYDQLFFEEIEPMLAILGSPPLSASETAIVIRAFPGAVRWLREVDRAGLPLEAEYMRLLRALPTVAEQMFVAELGRCETTHTVGAARDLGYMAVVASQLGADLTQYLARGAACTLLTVQVGSEFDDLGVLVPTDPTELQVAVGVNTVTHTVPAIINSTIGGQTTADYSGVATVRTRGHECTGNQTAPGQVTFDRALFRDLPEEREILAISSQDALADAVLNGLALSSEVEMDVSLAFEPSEATLVCDPGDPKLQYDVRDRFAACLQDQALSTPNRYRVTASAAHDATEMVFGTGPQCVDVAAPGGNTISVTAPTLKVRIKIKLPDP